MNTSLNLVTKTPRITAQLLQSDIQILTKCPDRGLSLLSHLSQNHFPSPENETVYI